jgi:hypothetical protein
MKIHIGDTGVTETSLHPQGAVQLYGRRWPARAEQGSVPAGTDVVVVGGDNMGLVVRVVEAARPANGLPGYGRPVRSAAVDRLAETAGPEADEAAARADRRRRFLRAAAAVGAAAALAVLMRIWDHVTDANGPTWQAIVLTLAGGAGWGVLVFLNLAEVLRRFDGGAGGITAACTALAIAGGAVGAAVGIPTFGWLGGVSLALVATLTCALALPLLMVAGDNIGPAA